MIAVRACTGPMAGATFTRYDAALGMQVEAMKRRSRAGRKPVKALPRTAWKLTAGKASKAVTRRGSASARPTEVARLTRERDEAQAQQAATADVLQIISSSPGNLDTVLETILVNATRLCKAKLAGGALVCSPGSARVQ